MVGKKSLTKSMSWLRVSKKTENPTRENRKKKLKKPNREKKPIKPVKILKKPTSLVSIL